MATATVPRRPAGQSQNGSMGRRREHSSHRSSYPPRNVGGSRSPMYLPSSPGEDDVFTFPDTASSRSAHSRSETSLLRKPINHQGPLRHSQGSLRPTQGVLKFAQQPAHLSKGPYESWSTLRTAQGAGTNSVSSSVPPSSVTYPTSSKTSQVSQDYVRRDAPNFVSNKYHDPRSPRRPVTRSQSPPAPRSISSSTRRSPSPKALSNSGRSSSSPKENTNSLRYASQNAVGRKSPAPANVNTADRKAAEKGLPKMPASAVEVVLRKRICFLSGGRDKRRGPIITFPTHPKPVEFSPEEIGLNVAFLASVPSPESRSRGFSVIIDVRAPTWRANKSLVKVLQQTLGRQLAQVIIVKPDTFWDKQKTSFRYRNDKAEGGYETIMVTASKIFQYVDQDQLTKDLGGTLPYDHDDWVQKRLDMEKFARDSAEMCQQLDQLEHAVNTQLLSDTIAIGDRFIFQYNHFRRKARTVAVETINFGKELLADLQKFIESGFASDYSKHTEDTVVAVATVKKQLSAVEGRENKLLELLEEQIREEVYGMQLSSLEKGAKEVVEWILGTGQQMLGSNHRIGQNLTSAESYRKEHEQIQLRCTDVFAKYSELTHKAELLLQEGYGVTDDIKAQRDYMDTVCRNFASRMERRRNLLVSSVKFLRVAQGLSRALDSLLEQVLSDTIPEDVQAAERAIARIQEFGENVEREFKEAMKEGQVLMDLLSGLVKDAFGKDVTPDHTRDFQHTKNKLEDLERRKLRCDELGDVRKLRLQQILQLRTCERDANQAIQWLEELCGVMVRTHTDVGKTAGEAGRLKEEHDKFQSTAKSTYDYGKQLLQAALVLRRSCHYNCQPNHFMAVRLEKAWNKFSKCLDERASRLFITHDFHKKADTLLLDMRNLIHSMQLGAAADSLQESAASMIVRRREETEDEYEETMRMGNSLMVRLAMPIMDKTSQHKIAEDTREAIDLVQKKQKQLDVRKKEAEDVWKENRKRLEAPLKIRQLHREMKQSLQDIQLRIADAMPGLLEVGRSLEEAKRLKKQHEDLMGKLKGKQGHVNELLHQADNVVINKEPDLDVYEAMAESLGEAWKDLNAQLEDRRLLLDAAILFHESVKQFTDKLNMAHRLFSPLTLPQDVDTIRLQLQKHHQTKKEILEASMETMNRGQVLLDRMHDMGTHIESKHATTAACYGVEHMLENLHDRRRHMEEVWALQKLRLEKSLQLCIWKQEVNDVTGFYKSQGESYMNASNLGENAPATQILIDLHREITDKAKPMYDQVKRLLRVAESFIVGGHYDSPTIQSMAGNLHVQWETFMDRLDRRTKYLQMAFDFYQRAGEAIKKLESIDIQLSAQTRQAESTAKLAILHASLAQEILETISPPLHDGYILIDLIGRGKPQLAGIEQKVDELEGWKKELDERCQAHLEDAQQKGEMFLVFQERHAHLFTWLTGVVDTFLAMHADMGTILPAALEFLSNHERLEKDMKDREPQVDIVLQAAEEFMKTGAVEAHECDVKTRDIQAHWGRVGRVVRKRIGLGAIYVAFHKLARRLANEMDDLDELLKRTPTDGTKGLEIAIHRHDDQWKEVQEAFTVMERKGREFLSEVKLVRDDPQLDTERAVLCVETLLEHFGERKRTIQDQRTGWQQKLQAEEEFKQDWLRFMQEVKKTIEWIMSLEREIFPTSGAELGTNLEDAVDLQDKLRKFMPTAEKTSEVVEGHVKTAEMLAARGETGPQKESLIMDLLRVHQRFQARLAEYILLLEMAIAFFDNINKTDWLLRKNMKEYQRLSRLPDMEAANHAIEEHSLSQNSRLNMLIDKADKDFKQTSPQDAKQVEDFLRQHEAVKKDVSKVFDHTTDSGEKIVLRVRENEGVDAARVTVEQALTMLDMRRIQWLKEWEEHRRRLEQGIKMCQLLKDIEKLREQLSELADQLLEFQTQLKEAKTSHTISIIVQKFDDFTSQVTAFRYRFEGLSGQVDEALKEGWDNLAPLLSQRKDLRDRWHRFLQDFDAFGTRLPLAQQLFTNMQEIEAWLVETTKMLFELEQQARAVKTKEEAKALLPPVEQKAKEAEMQEGRVRYVSELSVRVHGKDEGEKATRHVVVQFHEVRETITYVRTEIKTKMQTLPSKHDLDMKPQIEVIKKVETPTKFELLSPPPPKKKVVPPSFAQKLTSAVVDEGSPFRFECCVEGDPTPAITWYKDNDNIASSSIYETAFINNVASLTIAEVFVEDEARYMCKASNPGGQAICSAKLTVKAQETEPPPQPPVLNMNLQDIQVMEGEEITLVVKVTAHPQPDVYWFCDGQPVKESSGVRIVLQGVDTFSLVIKEAYPEDSGMYSFLAKNAHGEAHGSCKVTVERYAETTDTEVLSDSEHVAPTVYETLRDRDVLEGSKIRMDCVIIGTPEPEIIWYFKDKPLKESHNKMLLFEGDKCSLVINEARYSDRGEYKCVAINPAGKAETAMTLEVEPLPATDGYLTDESKLAPKKPDIPPVFVQNFEERIYYEGAEARLTCRVQGRPAPTVTWYKDDVQVVPTGHIRIVQIGDTHSVMFKHVGEEDYGIYMCVAANRAGSVSRCGHVSLKGPGMEPPRFTQELADARGVEGTPVGLVCRVTGKPDPSVVFYRDGNVIHESEDFKIVIQGDLCSLLIPEVLVQDEGTYMARAVNPAGEASTSAVLRVEGELRAPTFIRKLDKQLKVKEGRVVMLEVMVDGCPKPKVKWFMDEEPVMSQDYDIVVDGGRHALTIKEVFDEDAGVFKCRAKNSQGEVLCTCQLSVDPPSSDEEREKAEAPVVQQPAVQPTVQPAAPPAAQPVQPVEEPPMEVERVPEPPIIRNMEPPKFVQPIRSIAVVEGKRAEFEGLVTGDPQPEVTWYKDGQDCSQNPDFEITYIEGHTKLVIPEVFDEDAGKYTCKAKNQAGTAASTAELVVKAVTEPPDFTQRLQSMQASEGAQVRLEVRISGVPTPEIKWFREGAEIQTSHDFQIIREGDLAALVIREAFPEDSGKFSVTASNSVGRATSAAHLVISAAEESVAMEAATTEQVQITQAQTQAQQMDLGSGFEPGPSEVREAVVSAAARRAVGGVQYGEQTVSTQQVAVAEEERRRAVQMEVEEAQAPPPAPPAEPEAMETGISQPVFQKQAGQQQIYQQEMHGRDPMQQVHQMRAMQQQVQSMQQLQQQQMQPNQMQQQQLQQQQMLQLQQQQLQQHQLQQQQLQHQQMQQQHQVQSLQQLQQPVFTMQQVEGLQHMAPIRTVQQLPGMQQHLVQQTTVQQYPGVQHHMVQQTTTVHQRNPGVQQHVLHTSGHTTVERMQPALAAIHPASVIHAGHAKEGVYRAHPEEVQGSPGQRRRALIQLHEGIHADFDAHIPYFPRALSDITAEEGECVIFECIVLGEPQPHVKWFREGAEIESSPDFTISMEGDVARLVISEVFIDDAGKFTCTALNDAGSRSCYCFLHVNAAAVIEIPPPPPPPPKVEEGPHDFVVDSSKGISKPTFAARLMPCKYVEGQTVIFKIPVDGNPRPEISWTFNGLKIESGVRHQISYEMGFAMLSISMLLPEDCGEYAVTASSPSGQATQKARLMTEAEYAMWLVEEEEKAKKAQRISLVTEMEEKFSASETEGEAVVKPSAAGLTRQAGIAEARIIESKISMEGYGEYLEAKKSGASPERGPRSRSRSPRRDTTEPGVKEKHFRPQIVQRPEDLEVIEGQMARFDLKVSGRPPPDIQWFLNGQPVQDDATHKAVVNEGGIRSLLIIPATPDDSGEYTCVAVNRAGKASFTVRLNVVPRVIGERPEFLQRIQNVQVQEGAAAEMRTRIHGVPYPQIAWQKDGYTISERPGLRMINQDGMVSLIFDITDKEDDGWYTAVAFNSAGTVATRCKLTVIPTLKKAEPPQRLVVAKSKRTAEFKREEVTAISKFGEESVDEEDLYDKTRKQRPVFKTKISPVNLEGMGRAHFECRLVPIGDPNMKVEWLNNGQPIEAANRLQYVNEFGFVSMDYLVAYPRDTGIITCRAVNQHGEAETSSRLVVKDVPGKIEETQLPEGMRGISKLTEYERRLRESTMRTYVDEAEPEFEKAPPEIVMPPEGCRVVEGDQAKFHCRITGHPQPKVRWYLNGTIIRKSKRFRVWYDGIFHFEIPECKTLYAGEVKVVAENSQGTAETVVPLEVQLKEDYRTILKTPPKTAADPDLRRYHRLKGREELTVKRDRSPGFEMPKLKKVEKVTKEKSEAELASVELQKKFQKRFEPGYYEKLAGMELKGITKEEIKIEAKPLKKREVAVEAAPARAAPPPEKRPKKEPGMEEPKFTQKMQNQKLKPGEQCRFEAKVTGKPEPRISWFKNGAELQSSDRIQITRDGTTCVLTIPNPDHEDSGTYVCKADNAAGSASCTAFLLVPKVVELGFTKELADVTAKERDATAVFEADVNQEFAKPRWYKDGVEITMGDKYQQQVMRKCLMLVVRNVTLEDAGQYTCQVEKATSSATLTVTERPLEVTRSLQPVTVYEQETASFEVEISHEGIEVQWERKGSVLTPSDRVTIEVRGCVHRLVISNVSQSDAGEYAVVIGDFRQTTQLVVEIRKLEFTRPLQNIKIFEKQTATFEVEINFSGVDVQWLKNGEAIAPSDRYHVHADQKVHKLEILNVTVEDSGEYSFVAMDTKATATLYVDTKHVEFIRKIYEPVRCSPGETATFELEISEEDVEGQWFRNEVTLSTSDKYRFEQVGGVRRLYISNVTLEDQGDYSFVANDAQTSVTLYVEVKYVEFRRKPMETITVKPNEVATFEFEVTDQYKDVDVSWYRNEIRIETSEKYKVERDRCVHRLLIADTEQGDSGEYVFVAGETREVVTLYVEVTVDEETPLPDIQIRSAPHEPIRVDPHDTAVLEIEISEEDFDAQWLHKDLRLEISDKYVIERDRFTHRLLIYDTLPEDAGDYVFVAGETRHVFTIYVETAHVEMQRTIEAFEVVEYQTATLQFEIDEDVSAVQWLHNDKEIHAGEKYQMESEKRLHKLSIINITQDDAGNYTLVAGEARYTTTLIVKPAELEMAAPQFTQTLKSHIVEAGEPIRFQGTVTGHPPPTVSWLKNGQPIEQGDKYKFVTDGNVHTLLVINSSIEDSAEYACVASNDVGMATSSAQLLVEEHGVEEAMEEEVRPPHIVEPIQGTETREGEGAGFTCRIEGTEVDVTWYRNDSPIKPSKYFQLMSEGEYYVLNISEAFPEDAGTYKVVAVNPAGEDQCAADLQVEKAVPEAELVKPAQVSPAFIKDLQNQTTPEGSSARFECRIQGKPDPTVTWYKNGTELKETSDFKMSRLGDVYSLVIAECLPEDSGMILCKAVNPAGQVQSQAQLSVQVDETVIDQEVTQVVQQAAMATAPGPKISETVDGPTSAPSFTQTLQGQTAVLGERAKFEAVVNVSPDTKVVWLHNGVEIKGDKRHLIQLDRKTGRCVLIITKLVVLDSGEYALQVINALGEAACTAQLLFQEKQVKRQMVEGDGPNFTKMLSGQVVEEGSTARMEVGVGCSPAPTVTWLFNGVEIKPDQRRKVIADAQRQLYALVIEKVQPSDQGNYTCKAMNKFGEAGCTGQLFVQPPGQKVKLVQGEAPNFLKMLESKAAEEGSTARLEIVVSGNPEPKVFWYHNGKEIRPDQRRQLQYDQARHLHALVIPNVQSEDDGEYTANVRNDFGEAACTSSLHVYAPGQRVQLVHGESPNFAQMLESQAVEEGGAAKLQIVTSGSPEPTVTWLFGGVELKGDARRKISVDSATRSHLLVIQQVQESDSGEYTARVQNDFGIAECTAQILVYPHGQKVTIVQEGVQNVAGGGQTVQVVQGTAGQNVQVAQGKTGMEGLSQSIITAGQRVQAARGAPQTIAGGDQAVQVIQSQTVQSGQGTMLGGGQVTMAQGGQVTMVQGGQGAMIQGESPNIAEMLESQAVEEGGVAKLQIVTSGTPEPTVTWLFGEVELQGDARRQISVDSATGSHLLVIQQVQEADSGEYTARVENDFGITECTAQILVYPRGQKVTIVQEGEQNVTGGGQTVQVAQGKPGMEGLSQSIIAAGQRVQASRGTTQNTGQGGQVTMVQGGGQGTTVQGGQITMVQGGQGMMIQGGQGMTVVQGQHIVETGTTLQGEPPNFGKMPDSQAVEEGGTARFETIVTGSPEPEVAWLHNGQELKSGGRYQISVDSANHHHILVIQKLTKADAGKYTARVGNQFGEAACTAELHVVAPGQKVKMVKGESPNFAKMLESQAVEDGSAARFEVVVTGNPEPTVIWQYNGQELKQDQRREVISNKAKGQHVLLIESVQQSDSGDYTARVRNDFGEAACTAQLLVYPPGQKVKLVTGESPNFAKFPSSAAVADGDPARFDAVVTGSPVPNVTWLHMGTEIRSDTRRKVVFDQSKNMSSIVISQVQPSDGGDYTCQLTNDYGQAACTAQLLVKAPYEPETEDSGAAPEILRPCRNILTMEGHTVYFQCKVAAMPLPKVTWYKDEVEVRECGNVTFEESCVDDRTVLVTMVIMNVRPGDHGCYTCHAVNSLGETVCQAYLDVQGAKR